MGKGEVRPTAVHRVCTEYTEYAIRITFELPPPDTPLSAIRKSLAEYTHLPEHAFKLIHAGAVMKDDAAPSLSPPPSPARPADHPPVSAYHLHPSSTIALIGAADIPNPATAPPQRAEQPVLDTIQAELAQVRAALAPALAAFLADPTHRKEHLRLGELLLQALIRLDGIAPEPSWEHARKERKEAVREVQDMLDRLDGAWSARQS